MLIDYEALVPVRVAASWRIPAVDHQNIRQESSTGLIGQKFVKELGPASDGWAGLLRSLQQAKHSAAWVKPAAGDGLHHLFSTEHFLLLFMFWLTERLPAGFILRIHQQLIARHYFEVDH